MNPQLQEAIDAFEKADAAGNVEDAKELADYIRQLQAQEESSSGDMIYPAAGAAIGSTFGAIAGPAVGSAVDTAATKVAEKVAGPKGTQRGDKVAKWLATQTTGPNAGGATFEEAYKKSEIARGKPVQSRGSQIPIRKGFLGIENQPAEPSLPQKTAANIISSERLGKPSVPRRVGGMGVFGAEAGKTISDIEKGDTGGAILSGIGTVGGALSQSRIKPLRAIGTGLSLLVPTVQGGKEVKDIFYPSKEEEEKKAAGGLVHLAEGGKLGKAKSVTKKLSEVLIPREGQTLLGTMADRTKATGGFSGGPGFINLHPEYTWAMDSPGAANRLLNAVNQAGGSNRAVVSPMLMSTTAHRSNRPVFEKMYFELLEDIRSGKVTPQQIEALNAKMAGKKELSGAPDITSKEFLEFANAFKRRGAVADVMGQKRIGALDLQRHLDETIDPALREAELGAVGPQLFTAESQILKPDVHPGYKNLIIGEKGEDQFTPVPREFLFRDLEAKAMKELGRPLSDYNYRQSVGIPSQIIDEKLIRSLQELGYAKGGSTTPAWQRSEGKSPSGGLNALGRASYKRETGGELKPPVSAEAAKKSPKKAARRKSFCARMSGNPGPMKDEKGRPTRKALALRKWDC